MPVTVLTSVQQEPLSVLEVKTHLRIDFPDDDLYLAGLISQVRDFAEQETRRSLAPQTLQNLIQVSLLPSGAISGPIGWRPSEIELYMPPVDTVSLLEGEYTPGLFQAIDPSNYIVDTATAPGYIYLLSSAYSFLSSQWSLWIGPYSPRFRITYTAGYSGPNTVPLPFLLRRAMLELLAYWYNIREGHDNTVRFQIGLPLGIQSKFDKYRVFYGSGGGI
jgi:hypothetical protein